MEVFIFAVIAVIFMSNCKTVHEAQVEVLGISLVYIIIKHLLG